MTNRGPGIRSGVARTIPCSISTLAPTPSAGRFLPVSNAVLKRLARRRWTWGTEIRPARARPAPTLRDAARRWIVGALIASLLVALISPSFINSLSVYEWSTDLNDYVLKDGYVKRKRDEGWASSRYGASGFDRVAGMGDSRAAYVMIWGDSYVEAYQVRDDQKTAYQLNQALAEQGLSRLRAVAVGHALWSVADYYFRMAQYEKLCHPACHFLILAEQGLKDLCPDGETFRSEPAYQFVPRTLIDPAKSKIVENLYNWGLSDAFLAPWKAARTVMAGARHLRFLPGPSRGDRDTMAPPDSGFLPPPHEPNSIIESWNYALDTLKARTTKPIVLVLVPEVPRLEHGVVCYADSQSAWRAKLVELCRTKNIGCIDMTETLAGDYRATGKFSRGFHNGRPASGHLNARGHWLLSQQICAYLKERRDCL